MIHNKPLDYEQLFQDEQYFESVLASEIKNEEWIQEAFYHRDWVSQSHQKNIQKLMKFKQLHAFKPDIEVRNYNDGMIVVNKKYVVSLATNKWSTVSQLKNKPTWYRYKNIEDLVTRYILKEGKQ